MQRSAGRAAAAALVLACASTGSAAAQSVVQGPDLIRRAGGEYTFKLSLDAAAPMDLIFWKEGQTETDALRRTLTGGPEHTYSFPAGDNMRYRFVLGGTPSPVFAAPRERDIDEITASISSLQFEGGNQLVFDVTSMFANSVQVTATKADGSTMGGTISQPLRNGVNKVSIGIPCSTPGAATAVSLRVLISGPLGEVTRKEEPHQITCPTAPPAPVQFNGLSVVAAGARMVRFTTSFSNAPTTVFYKAELRAGRFVTEETGSCSADNCVITITGLAPGTTYSYALSAAPAANAAYIQFQPGVVGNDVTTDSLPRITATPTIALEGDKNNVQAKLSLKSDKPTRLRLIFTDANAGIDYTDVELTPPTTNHERTLPAGITMKKIDDRTFEMSFRVEVYDASDDSKIGELPLSMVGVFQSQKNKGVLSRTEAVFSEFLKDYGLPIKDVFQTRVLPALATAAVAGL